MKKKKEILSIRGGRGPTNPTIRIYYSEMTKKRRENVTLFLPQRRKGPSVKNYLPVMLKRLKENLKRKSNNRLLFHPSTERKSLSSIQKERKRKEKLKRDTLDCPQWGVRPTTQIHIHGRSKRGKLNLLEGEKNQRQEKERKRSALLRILLRREKETASRPEKRLPPASNQQRGRGEWRKALQPPTQEEGYFQKTRGLIRFLGKEERPPPYWSESSMHLIQLRQGQEEKGRTLTSGDEKLSKPRFLPAMTEENFTPEQGKGSQTRTPSFPDGGLMYFLSGERERGDAFPSLKYYSARSDGVARKRMAVAQKKKRKGVFRIPAKEEPTEKARSTQRGISERKGHDRYTCRPENGRKVLREAWR